MVSNDFERIYKEAVISWLYRSTFPALTIEAEDRIDSALAQI
jgi:hypothetical protein